MSLDGLTITNANGPGGDYQGLAGLKRRYPQGEAEFALPGQTAPPQDDGAGPLEEQNPAGAAPDSGSTQAAAEDLPRLNLSQAREVLDETTPAIAQASPWRLAEIQPVADRSLLPSSYV